MVLTVPVVGRLWFNLEFLLSNDPLLMISYSEALVENWDCVHYNTSLCTWGSVPNILNC